MAIIYFLGSGPLEPVGSRPDEKETRLNSSLLISQGNYGLLIDVTPYFSQQIQQIKNYQNSFLIKDIILTHAHADCIDGIPQLKSYFKENDGEKYNLYSLKETLEKVKEKFEPEEYCNLIELKQNLKIGPFEIEYLEVLHSLQEGFPTVALRIKGDKTVIYSEDFAGFKKKEDEEFFKNKDCLIIDGALYKDKEIEEKKLADNLSIPVEQSVGHLVVDIIGKDESNYLKWLASLGNEITIITQRGRTWPITSEASKIIQNIWKKYSDKKIILAYDGLKLDLYSGKVEKGIIEKIPKIWTEEKKKQLLDDHRLLHIRFKNLLAGKEEYHRSGPLAGKKISRRWIIRSHERLVKLIFKVGYQHNLVDELDETLSEELKKKSRKVEEKLEMQDSVKWGDDGNLRKQLNRVQFALTTENASVLIPERIATEEKPKYALYLTHPHGKLIFEGKKSLIIKKIKLRKHLNEPLLLISDSFAYGFIKLGLPQEIGEKEFEELYPRHLVSKEEALKWWKSLDKLYAYEVSIVVLFSKPEKVFVPRGVQNFIKISKLRVPKKEGKMFCSERCCLHEFSSGECISKAKENLDFSKIIPDKIKNLTNQELIILHLKLHWEFENKKPQEATEKYVNAHYFIVQEFVSRKLRHYMRDDLDRLTEKLRKMEKSLENIEDLIAKGLKEEAVQELKNVGDLMVIENYVSWVGSGPNESNPQDIDILVRDAFIFPIVKLKILRRLKSIADHLHIFSSPTGPNSGYRKLWSLVLRKEPFDYVKIDEDRYKENKSFEDSFEDSFRDLGKNYDFVEDYIRESNIIDELEKTDNPDEKNKILQGFIEEVCKRVEERLLSAGISPALFMEESLKPLSPFIPAKTGKGYGKNEFFDLEALLTLWASPGMFPIAVEEKFDGLRIALHKKGDKILINFEDAKRPREDYLPCLAEDLRNLKVEEVILDGELLDFDKEGNQIPRKDLIHFVIGKGKQDDSRVKVMVFDILWYNGEDLHQKTWEERQEYLKKVLDRSWGRLHRVIPIITKNKAELKKAIEKVSSYEMSEGAMCKAIKSTYPLTGSTFEWAKIKTLKEYDAIVLKVNKTKAGTYNYDVGVSFPLKDKEKYLNVVEFASKFYIKIGTTYNTKLKAKEGDIITVGVVEVKISEEDGKIKITHDNPIVRNLKPGKTEPDDVSTMERLAKARRGKLKRVLDLELEDKILEENFFDLEEDEGLFLKKLGEEGETRATIAARFWRKEWQNMYPVDGEGEYVLQLHIRGLSEEESKKSLEELTKTDHSVHYDLRCTSTGKLLWGFTIFAGEMKEVREAPNYIMLGERKLQGEHKLAQGIAWLHLPQGYVSRPSEVGATSAKYAKFFTLARGKYSAGTWRLHMQEIFFNSGLLKGRYIIAYAPVAGRRIWLISRPKEERWYSEIYDKDKVIAELKKKKQKYLWWREKNKKPELIEVT